MPEPMRPPGYAQALIRTIACTFLLVLGMGSLAQAQAIHDPTDIHFKVLNATTGGAGNLDRLQIQYRSDILNPVIDVVPDGSNFTLKDVPVLDRGRYILTAWKNGVPYFSTYRGSKLMDQEISLHIFDTTASSQDISMSGLTLLVKKIGPQLQLEYMIKVENAAMPQITVLGNPTFEMKIPEGCTQIKAEYKRGPDPINIPVTRISAGLIGLTVPFTSGQNSISLTASVPFTEGMELPVSGNLPISSWSLMTFPISLISDSFELEPDNNNAPAGWNRYVGSALESGRGLAIRLISEPKGGQEKNLFSKQDNDNPDSPSDVPAEAESEAKSKFPWIPMGVVTILIIAMAVRRRRR